MNEVVKNLKNVKQLLSDPIRWTAHSEARNALGAKVAAGDNSARAWCLTGAVFKCLQQECENRVMVADYYLEIKYHLNQAAEALYGCAHAILINDCEAYGFNAVHKLLDFVIADLEENNG